MVRKKTPPWYGLSGGPMMVACQNFIKKSCQILEEGGENVPASGTSHLPVALLNTELGGPCQGPAVPC